MRYCSETGRADYYPPVLGNGDISFSVDAEGAVCLPEEAFPGIEGYAQVIYRAGRRLGVTHKSRGGILSFGTLHFEMQSTLVSFTQELAEQEGLMRSECVYEDGTRLRTEAFIHPEHPLYCVRKTVLSAPGTVKGAWHYRLCGYDELTEEAILRRESRPAGTGGRVAFVMSGMDRYRGEARLLTQGAFRAAEAEAEGLCLPFAAAAGESVSLFFCLADDRDGEDPAGENETVGNIAERLGFAGLLEENRASWRDYYARGYVRTADEMLDRIYSVALYHLRCLTTKWSIPVGLNQRLWHGKFFAFDEYYNFLGLLTANRKEQAKRVPVFRLEVCLEKAVERQTRFSEEQARFCWETDEYGQELAPPGHWMDHVFHMAVIALGAFEYYEYTRDLPFLKRCYRMIRACAKFFTLHMIYRDGDSAFVGRCTDLERLGSSVENPFMTGCGVIRTLEVTAEAAKILGTDEGFRAECLELAEKLRGSLPAEEGRYVPYLGCPEKSIGVFSGMFPFRVLEKDDGKLLAAWQDYTENGGAFGNMYPVGVRLSPWYAAWQAEGFARAGMGKEAYACLKLAYDSVGVFGEMFEINEPAVRMKPWFTTAAGVFLSAVSDMLVESDGETVRLLPACPLEDVSFRLAVKGGAVLEAEIRGGVLLRAELESDTPKTMQLIFRDTVREIRS